MQPCGRNDNREYDKVDEYAFPATKLSSRNSMQQPDAIDGKFLCIGILKIRISMYFHPGYRAYYRDDNCFSFTVIYKI